MKKVLLGLTLIAGVSLANDEAGHHHKGHKASKCITKVSKKEYKNPSLEVLKMMHNPMMCNKWVESGDANRDYLENMIPHHMGAVLSSQALLKYTKDDRLKKIAKDIISAQEKEIAEFKELLGKLSKQEVADYEAFNKKAKEDMHKMMKEMKKTKKSNNVDKDFLNAMIAHHQGAIDASKQILEVSDNDKIKHFAKDIISAQEKEIAEFKNLLKEMK